MTAWLPIVAAQVHARHPDMAIAELRSEVLDLVREFPRTRMIFYPEYHTCRVSGSPKQRRSRYGEIAELVPGPRTHALANIAKEAAVWLLPGSIIERSDNGEIYNTSVAFSPDGKLAATYRKIFPWRPFEPFASGKDFVVFPVPGIGNIGLSICYDIWFPEVARQLAWLGADIIVCPHQTSGVDREQELILTRATAIQNQVFVVNINASEPDGTGQTIIADPEGLVRVQAPSESATFVTDVLDVGAVRRVRENGTAGLNRMWQQLLPDDPQIHLPLYDGSINSNRWSPGDNVGNQHET